MATNPFEGNSSENRLLYILEKDNVDFSKINFTSTGEPVLVAERGMSGGKIITILRQQAADEVDFATADLDSIRSEYSIGTYLMVPPLDFRVEMHEELWFEEYVWFRTSSNRWTIYPIDYPWVEVRVPLRCFTMGQSYYYDGRNGYMVGPTYEEHSVIKGFIVEEEDGKLTWSTNDVEYAESMGVSEHIIDREYRIEERSFTSVNEDGSTTIVEQAGVNKDLFATSSYPENKTKDVYVKSLSIGQEAPNEQGNNMADTVYLAKIVKELEDSAEFQVWNIDGTTLKTYNGGFFIALFSPDVTTETIDNTVNDMLNTTSVDVTVAVSDGLIGFFYVSQDKTEMFNTLTRTEEYDENLGTNVNKFVINYSKAYLPAGANPPSATLDFENSTFTIQAPYELGSPWIADPDNPSTAIGTTFTFQFATPGNGTTNPDTIQDITPTYVVVSTSLLDELAFAVQDRYYIYNSITIGDMIDIIKGTYTPSEDTSGGE